MALRASSHRNPVPCPPLSTCLSTLHSKACPAQVAGRCVVIPSGPLFSSVQSLSRVRLFATPRTAACQASLSITNSRGYPNSCPLSWWCHLTISSSVVPFLGRRPFISPCWEEYGPKQASTTVCDLGHARLHEEPGSKDHSLTSWFSSSPWQSHLHCYSNKEEQMLWNQL